MSSSTAGQWSPSPSPMSVTLLRASVPADARRGNQTSGTDKTRPSASWTISSSSVHRALTARGSPSTAKVLIPALLKELSILRDKARNSGQLLRRKPAAPRERDRCKPELRNRSIALHVNVRGLSILVRVEEEAMGTDDQNCRHTAMLHSPQRISCRIQRSKGDFSPSTCLSAVRTSPRLQQGRRAGRRARARGLRSVQRVDRRHLPQGQAKSPRRPRVGRLRGSVAGRGAIAKGLEAARGTRQVNRLALRFISAPKPVAAGVISTDRTRSARAHPGRPD